MTHSAQALTLGLWVQWPGGPVDLKTYWPPKKLTGPPKKLTGPYLKTKLARRKTICINLQFAHRPIIKLFRTHPRNIFQIWMVILKKKKKKIKQIYWPGGPVENQLLWPELARPPKKCVRDSGHISNVKPWCSIASCFIVPLRERCADVTIKTAVAPILVWHYIDSARLNTGASFWRRGSVTCRATPEHYAMNKKIGKFPERVRVFW